LSQLLIEVDVVAVSAQALRRNRYVGGFDLIMIAQALSQGLIKINVAFRKAGCIGVGDIAGEDFGARRADLQRRFHYSLAGSENFHDRHSQQRTGQQLKLTELPDMYRFALVTGKGFSFRITYLRLFEAKK
jgi:hypothetical protein